METQPNEGFEPHHPPELSFDKVTTLTIEALPIL